MDRWWAGDFATEAKCLNALDRLRWPEGFRCPYCACDESWRVSKNPERFDHFTRICRKCDRRTSLTVETVLEKCRIPWVVFFEGVRQFVRFDGAKMSGREFCRRISQKQKVSFHTAKRLQGLLHRLVPGADVHSWERLFKQNLLTKQAVYRALGAEHGFEW